MPYFLEFPISDKKDFEELKDFWKSIPFKNRIPENWDFLVEKYKKRTYPLVIGGYPIGFFGTLRNLMGPEAILYAFYDNPNLVKDMISFLVEHYISIWGIVLEKIKVDYVQIWEDMCYRGGSLISPSMFREFILPAYKKLSNFLKDMDINILLVDCDGDITELIPLWIEGGVTGIWPFEVQAGMDIYKIRNNFPKLQILGGINKKAIALGKKTIDNELKKVKQVLYKGGYIPFIDHCVPPDISWGNFEYYRYKLNNIIDDTKIL